MAVRRWLVSTYSSGRLIQSFAGRSRIHQCPEPMWLSTMSMTMPMPFAFASRDSATKSSLLPIRGSVRYRSVIA